MNCTVRISIRSLPMILFCLSLLIFQGKTPAYADNSKTTATMAAAKILSLPTLVSPKDGEVKEGKRIKLKWKRVPGAKKYQVMVIGPDKTRTSKWIKKTSLRFKIPKKNEAYSWKVRAKAGKRITTWCVSNVFFVKDDCVVSVSPSVINADRQWQAILVSVKTKNNKKCKWTVSGAPNWIILGPDNGKGSENFYANIDANLDKFERRAVLQIGQQTLTVTQDGLGLEGVFDFFYKYSTSSENTRAKLLIYIGSNNCRLESIPGASYRFKYDGKWSLNGNTIKLEFGANMGGSTGWVDVYYTGTLSDDYDFMRNGTMRNTRGQTGTWYAIREGATIGR